MSLDTYRNQILSNSSEGNVEVNQRDLIDKILARYSCKFVIYRELMQNSDDAESSSVKIIFETNGSKITRILFKNNGFAFRSEDWNRLVKIAEGNPDEQKIGAFGVGFYSLFSVTENPFVSSGGQGMAFYWRGNQVFTKQGPIDDDDKGWTTFLMDTREPLEIPNIEEFARFLVNSLGFTENLKEVSMYIDDVLIIQLSKKMQEPKLVEIAPDLNTFSPKNMFHLTSVDFRGVQLDVKRLLIPTKLNIKQLRSHMYQTLEESILFRIANGNLDVKVSKEFSAKMERVTKKKPPNNTFIQMIYAEFDERNLSKDDNKDISPIYKDLISYPEQGKIYIGFPTNQTTGSCSHLAARVIPTMERELIDFAEPTLAEYNNEMLCLAGTLSRILYEYEMAQITNFYNEIISSNIENNEETKRPEKSTSKSRSKRSLYKWLKKRVLHFSFKKRTSIVQMTQYNDEKISPYRKWLEKWAAYAIAHFTYNTGTPNMQVSTIAETQFSSCLKQNLLILSTHGVLPISSVRLPNPKITGFIKTVPLVPKNLLEQCNPFFNKAKEVELIAELGLQDVLDELKIRTLSEEEIIKLLKWWISYLSEDNNYFDTQLLKFARIGDSSQTLNTIQFYSNPNKIPLDMSIPYEVLPINISRNFTGQELENRFGWTELPLVNWAKFIVKKPELESDFEFAEKVHHVLAKNLEDISQEDKETIRQLFVEKKCIPTEFGMKFPNESYFQSVDLFPNLPTIKFQDFTSSVRRLMEHFGVRMSVELNLILKRLVNQEDCYYIQIIKYLASISDDLSEDEKNILKNESIWPKENLSGSQSEGEIQRFVARDLYTPLRSHRELGLHLIDWNVEWTNSSKEGKFLIELGLREHPNLETIIKLAAPPTDPKIQELALKYFIDNFDIYSQFYKPEEVNIAFLPCSNPNTYAKPSECYADDKCTIMNFQIIREDLRSKAEKFGVRQHPNHEKLVKWLTENPPQNKNKAKEIFEYLNSQQKEFTDFDWNTLNDFEFIPIQDVSQSDEIINKLIKPRECLFKLKEESLNDFFPCVDFGTKANKFLAKCGVKNEPSSADFVQLSVNSSHKLWNLYLKKYLNILEIINPNLEIILELSAPPIDPKIREMSLKYFIDNFDNKYSKHYKPEDINIAFLPCSNSNTYAKPSECFIDDRCMIMNFETIREDLRSKVEKFGVRQHPNHEKLVKRLTENPPQNKNEATEVFEYLNSLQHDFTDFDWNSLNNFEFIPIQNKSQSNEIINNLVNPRGCFFKLKEESLNDFFLCVDFGTKANKFLAKCGVKEPSSDDFARLSVNSSHKLWNLYVEKYPNILEKINPNLETILELAAPPSDPKFREMALKYFIDNFDKKYSKDYNLDKIDIAFLPCSNPNTYAKPSECFIDDRCMIMNFRAIRKDLRSNVENFGVRKHPNHEKLVKSLTENPPQNEDEAKKVFEYLDSQQHDFTGSDWDTLNNFEFIPIKNESQSNGLIKPRDCFFKLKEESLNEFFPCVDFGIKANRFLAKCGVNDEPSSADFARLLVNSPNKLWNLYKNDITKYLEKIKFNENLDNITSGKKKDDDNLIAIKIGHNSKGNDDYYLALVKEIYINDDKVYQQVLNPLVAPKNLESLYKKLGCKSLYESVTKSVVPHGHIQKTKYSQQLQRIIRERASLFYLNHSEEEIKNDNKWLKKLKVREVEYMETSYKLESITKNERNNITTNIKESTDSWTLYVTSNSNLIDISQNILGNIFKSYNSKDISYFNTILTAPLSSLKHMGIFEPELPIFSLLKDDQQSQQQDGSEDSDIKSFENEKPITITSENTQDLRNLLQYSIKSRYSNSESNINSIKGLTKTCINESQVNSCDIIPGYSMRCVGNSQKIELYVSNGIDQSEILSQSRIAPLSQFINILKDLADVFEITPKAIHIFYDNSVNSIAFNRDGALFFNLKFYIGLHEQECKSKPTIDAMTYWFMMFCHVLAHNFVQLHNSEFEYYYSSFAKIYMPNFLEKMKKREITLRSFNIKTFWKNFSRILTRI